ncbi:MAG: hypothetical protein QW393_04845 [Candidatus Micrarchaeaceae archaeon]
MKIRTEYKDTRGSIHLTPREWVKSLIPKDVDTTSLFENFIIAVYGSGDKKIEDIKSEIAKTESELARLQGRLIDLKRRLEDQERENERLEQIRIEVETNLHYARYIFLREVLSGSVISKQKAIKIAYGVEVTGEVLIWATALRKKFFGNNLGEEIERPDTEPFLRYLKEHIMEAYPGIRYVGNGEREKAARQEFLDVMTESKRLCSRGHVYAALEDKCPECERIYRDPENYLQANVPTIYLRFINQEFQDYISGLALSNALKKLDARNVLGQIREEQQIKWLAERNQERII